MNEVITAIQALGYTKIKDLDLKEAQKVLNQLTDNGTKKVDPLVLKDLANRVLADAPGDVTVLYGGKVNGVKAGDMETDTFRVTPCNLFLEKVE